MKLSLSITKWLIVGALAALIHYAIFQGTLKHKVAQAERVELSAIEIDLDIIEEVTIEEIADLSEEVVEEPIEKVEEPDPEPEKEDLEEPEPIEPEPTPEEIQELERIEEEKVAEEKRLLEELERIEEEKIIAEKKAEAERKKKEEIARKKRIEKKKKEDAVRKKKAKELAEKRAKQAAEKKKKALANKVAKQAYSTSRRAPTYPSSLKRKKIEGVVKVKVIISTSGRVESANIYSSSGHDAFDKSTLKAALKWKYKPAYNGLGQPIISTKIETVKFILK